MPECKACLAEGPGLCAAKTQGPQAVCREGCS